ncbi:replication initiator protein [Microviridae sp.]|nr:replication initiator protein [Microviridae sp.]
MPCFYPLEGYVDLESGGITWDEDKHCGTTMTVACGQCQGCRIDRSKEWAARIVHESQMHPENCFVTLTYDSENVPADGSLNREHFQKFMKRLRKHFDDKKIRYFHCGEYGEKLERPHYHACLFGIDFDDRVEHGANNSVVHYKSDTLEKIWGKGFCSIGELNYQTAAYTSRYILKKCVGKRAEEHYMRVNPYTGELINLEPEYVTMSLKPGIGRDFYDKYESDFFPSDECPVPGRGVFKTVPRYYENLYAKKNPDAYAKIKAARKEYHDTHRHEYTEERLRTKEKVHNAKIAQLKRS